ncbi:MAG TPA: SpoIIE family protein phosphatase [Gaiellaceae bacterium]|nr:SpoIIE family protein phosphatase [Gaiellaceae bacterium]
MRGASIPVDATPSELELPHAAFEALARAGAATAAGGPLSAAVAALAEASVRVPGAELAIVRVLDQAGDGLVARAVAPADSAPAAELEGSRLPLAEAPDELVVDSELLPAATRRAAARVHADAALFVPARAADRVVGSVEVLGAGAGGRFDAGGVALAQLAATQLAVAVSALGDRPTDGRVDGSGVLELAGEALSAGADEARAATGIVTAARAATGASAAVVWLAGEELTLVAGAGVAPQDERLETAREAAGRALAVWRPLELEPGEALPAGARYSATLPLGSPPLGALQLFYPAATMPDERELERLTSFGVRATQVLRASGKARRLGAELERTRALLAVVGQAIARLSLVHTLETAVERISELLAIERVAVYLLDGTELLPAAGRGLGGSHAEAAERLLELALGPFRARGVVVVPARDPEPALAPVRSVLDAAQLESAVAVPLRVREDAIGLLAAYPARGRRLADTEIELLESLAAQLSVAVQNAQLHEHAKQLGDALGDALASERDAAQRLRALYEISRSFAQSLSLDTTLEAVTRTIAEVLELDAAVIRTPDQRRDTLAPQAIHVGDARLAEPVRTILEQPQPLSSVPIQRLFRTREPLVLDADVAVRLGGAHALLAPFLEKGSTAAILPIATPAEVLASLTILSLDPARPIDRDTVDTALSIVGQAALAIDNARLYQQQKDFADTMQRSLLPDTQPAVPGLELGAVYESAATVAVGGDVYDFLELADGRLAVAVGDVTGHGIEATADMAMARFVFRSLAREHPEPADFLAHANEVVVGEIQVGKFITMAYLAADPARDEARCASAGHPEPRLLLPDGSVEAIRAPGIALGIERDQDFTEVCVPFPPGAAIVLYTDGVIEARRERELYGEERLDAVLSRCRGLSAAALVERVVADCRAFGGELTDDVAAICIRHLA